MEETKGTEGERRVGVGIPVSFPMIHTDFFDSWVQLRIPAPMHIIRAKTGTIADMRNMTVETALSEGCSHLLFIDADMVVPPDCVERMLADMEELPEIGILGALCFIRYPPFHPTLYVGEKYKLMIERDYPEGVIPVTATGAAVLMVKCDVFRTMQPPWFRHDELTPERTIIGEDIGFCYHAADAGFQCWVDTRIKTLHLTSIGINENLFRLNDKIRTHNNLEVAI